MNFIRHFALLLGLCCVSVNAFAKVVIVAPAGGLTGLASLVLANRIDEALHQRGHQFARLVDHGVGVSIGAQVVALLLEKSDNMAKRTTSEAVDKFLASSPGTFPLFTSISRELMHSYVEKIDIEKAVRIIFEERLTSLDADSLAKMWNGSYHSYASFWTKVPELLVTVNPLLAHALSSEGKLSQQEIVLKKLHSAFGDARFSDRDFDKITAITSYERKPVSIGGTLGLPKMPRADRETTVLQGLIASAAMPLFPDQYLNVDDLGPVLVTDGANACSALSPLESVVQWSLTESNEDDVIISLGNGGPIDSAYRERFNFENGVAVVKKGNETLTIFALEPTVNYWFMSTLVDEKGLTEDLIAAAQNVSDELIVRAARAMISAKGYSEGDALTFTKPKLTIHADACSTTTPPEELERTCKGVVDAVGVSAKAVGETLRAVENANRIAEEIIKQARLEEEARRVARELEEQKQRLEAETRRIARELEEQRRRAEIEAQRLAAEAQRQAQQLGQTVTNTFRNWRF